MEHDKYGSIIQSLNSQKSLGNNQHPRTIVDTNNMLSNHKFDMYKHKKQDNKHTKSNKNKEDIEGKEINPLSFLQMEGKCYCCVKPGHKSPDFITKDKITKYEWAINKSQQHVYNKNDYNKSTIWRSLSNKKEYLVIGWEGLHCTFAQSANMKEPILLESDSTETLFYKPKYVSNIQDLDNPLSINTNVGMAK